MSSRSWQQLAEAPGAERHVVQLYRDEGFLADLVAAWTRPALAAPRGAAVLICTHAHAELVRARLREAKLDVDALEKDGRLVVRDAAATMSLFMRPQGPDAAAFHRHVGALLASFPPAAKDVRAWGEMVNLLFEQGRVDAARRLESLWNDLLASHHARLLCSYRLDNLALETHQGALEAVCEGHSHLIPERDADAFEQAVTAALVETFGEAEAADLRTRLARQRPIPIGMPAAESVLVALARSRPEDARRVLRAARERMA